SKPVSGSVIGRLGSYDDPAASRFVALLPDDKALLESMVAEDMIGTACRVSRPGELNLFEPAEI
ncbi:MAG: hypothetical protein HOE54_14570, partial [Gammaproteobacteria bacterium]|nr:hypothetical protein [Gammaproteobacteria bacterium]